MADDPDKLTYYARNRERFLPMSRAYYRRNRERILARLKAAYIPKPRPVSLVRALLPAPAATFENETGPKSIERIKFELTPAQRKERRRLSQLKWSRANREKRKRYYQTWKTTHPGSYKAHTVRNDARKRAARFLAGADQLKQVDQLVASWRSEDFFLCNYCGRLFPTTQLHVEHFVPIIRGGLHLPGNLRKSCPTCNLKKGSKLLLGACWMFANLPCSEVLEFT